MKSGFVAILGRPNVGKSTLLNAILSKKVSIVTSRAQTTRDSIMGIYNTKDVQIVFIDTPGLFEGKSALDSTIDKAARNASKGVECALFLIDCSQSNMELEQKTIESLKLECPLIIVLNKIDLVRVDKAEEIRAFFLEKNPNAKIMLMSALKNFGIKEVKDEILTHLPEGPQYYPLDALTDKDKRFEAKEEIRREILRFVKDEVPHQSAVTIERFEEKKGNNIIEASIYVEKESQVAIIVGKKGSMIKKISMTARRELERMWQEHVTLEVEVKVAKDWRNRASKLAQFGYSDNN